MLRKLATCVLRVRCACSFKIIQVTLSLAMCVKRESFHIANYMYLYRDIWMTCLHLEIEARRGGVWGYAPPVLVFRLSEIASGAF